MKYIAAILLFFAFSHIHAQQPPTMSQLRNQQWISNDTLAQMTIGCIFIGGCMARVKIFCLDHMESQNKFMCHYMNQPDPKYVWGSVIAPFVISIGIGIFAVMRDNRIQKIWRRSLELYHLNQALFRLTRAAVAPDSSGLVNP